MTQVLFGSWRGGLVAAGLNADRFCVRPIWDRERIVEAILVRAVKREPLGSSTVLPRSLKMAAVKIFGSWANALVAAGLDPASHIGVQCSHHMRHSRPRRAAQ